MKGFFNDYNNKYNRIIFFIKYKKLVLNSLVKSKFTFQFSKIPSLKTYEMLKVVFYCVNWVLWKIKIKVF